MKTAGDPVPDRDDAGCGAGDAQARNAPQSGERPQPGGPRIAVLVNPTAGRGRAAAVGDAAVRRLRRSGADPSVFVGDSAAETRALAAAAVRSRPDALAVVGGDGTLALILDEVLGTGVPIALVPAGTGNDLARALGLPTGSVDQAAAAVDLVFEGEVRRIDVGEVAHEGRRTPFLTVCAIGLDARVADRTNRLRWPRGPLRYYLALAIELLRLRPLQMEVGIDGGPSRSLPGILLAVGNTRSYGGGIPMCPNADPCDGRLDVTHVEPIGRARLLRIFPLLLQARHAERPEATLLRVREIEVAAPGLIAYADGERVGEERVSLRLHEQRLEVFAGG